MITNDEFEKAKKLKKQIEEISSFLHAFNGSESRKSFISVVDKEKGSCNLYNSYNSFFFKTFPKLQKDLQAIAIDRINEEKEKKESELRKIIVG